MSSALTLRRLLVAATLISCLVGAFILREAGIDDVGISYRYARHLADGSGLTWNAGEEPVEGYSNLLWVLILAVGHLFGADIEILSRVLGLLLGVGTLYLTYRIASSVDPDTPHPFPTIVPLLVALTPAWLMWMMSGLEIALYSFLLVAATRALTMKGRRRIVVMSVSLSALILTRPEGIGLAGCYLFTAWMLRDKSQGRPLSGLLIPILAVLATISGATLFRLAYYGYPLPNTVYAKFLHALPLGRSGGALVGLHVSLPAAMGNHCPLVVANSRQDHYARCDCSRPNANSSGSSS